MKTTNTAASLFVLTSLVVLGACKKPDPESSEPVTSATPAATPEQPAEPAPKAASPAASIIPAALTDIPTTPVKTGGHMDVKSGPDRASFKVGAAWAIPHRAYDDKGEPVSGTNYEIKIVNDQDKNAKPCGSFDILSLGGDTRGVSIGHKGGYVPGSEQTFEIPGGVAFVTKATMGAAKGNPAMARTVDKTSKLTIKSVNGNVLTGSVDASGYGNTVKGDFVAQICQGR